MALLKSFAIPSGELFIFSLENTAYKGGIIRSPGILCISIKNINKDYNKENSSIQ